MKVSDLLEAIGDGSTSPNYRQINVEEAKMLIRKHGDAAWWMLTDNTPMWRGDKNLYLRGGIAYVDTTETIRKSQNTTNYYTMLFDHLPSWEGWPKRSRSLICTNDHYHAKWGYSRKPRLTRGDKFKSDSYHDVRSGLFALIPLNGAKIGCTNNRDIWGTTTTFFGMRITLEDLNTFFHGMGLDPNWESFQQFAKMDREEQIRMVRHAAAGMFREKDLDEREMNEGLKNFIGYVNYQLDPDLLNFEKFTTHNHEQLIREKAEFWVSGPCILFNEKAWINVREDLAWI